MPDKTIPDCPLAAGQNLVIRWPSGEPAAGLISSQWQIQSARVVELADTPDLGSGSARIRGSSPLARTSLRSLRALARQAGFIIVHETPPAFNSFRDLCCGNFFNPRPVRRCSAGAEKMDRDEQRAFQHLQLRRA